MSAVPYLGEIFALLAPICWSFAVILFRRTGETVPPIALNLFKTVLALVLFTLTSLVFGQEFLLEGASRSDYLLLLASGALGIGAADLFFFLTLNRVGAGLQAIINTSYSPAIIFLSYFLLGERLTSVQWIGVTLILSAVLTVGWMKGKKSQPVPRRTLWAGIAFGIGTSLTQGYSVVMIKPLLESTPLFWANWWRIVGGLISLLILAPLLPHRVRRLDRLFDRGVWKIMIPGSIMGTYISLIVWLAGLKFAQASIAAALNQTSTLWTFLLAVLLLKEPITWIRVIGLIVGVVGVGLVTFG